MKYEIIENNGRYWAMSDQHPIGAVAVTSLRSYTYPFFTPAGINVLQECPPDHPHHQGIMIGQDLVNGHNFWGINNAKYPKNYHLVESTTPRVSEHGIVVTQKLIWKTADGHSLLVETRQTRFLSAAAFNLVEVMTTWTAAYGPLHFAKTKEGGLGLRVAPQLETFWGGSIRSSQNAMGEKAVFDSIADWVEISGSVGNQKAGVVIMPHPSQKQIPWFSRDYGIHLFSPLRHETKTLSAGDSFTMRVAFAAFDGVCDGSQAAKAWQEYRSDQNEITNA